MLCLEKVGMSMTAVRELTYTAILLRVLSAVVLGGILGFERGMKNRPAGLRTYMLVCLGSCMVMITNQYIYQAFGTGDPVRMGAQVVSGIGFLGAGTIIVTARNHIKGLTTAAGLWAAACAGLALGIGLYEVAFLGGLSIFLILTILHSLDFRARSHGRVVEAYVELDRMYSMARFLRDLRKNQIEPSDVQMEMAALTSSDTLGFIITLKGAKQHTHDDVMRIVQGIDGVKYMEDL